MKKLNFLKSPTAVMAGLGIGAIVISISGLLKSENGRSFIIKIMISLVGTLLLLSIVCTAVSSIFPGIRSPSDDVKVAIGSMMSENSGHVVGFKHTSYFGMVTDTISLMKFLSCVDIYRGDKNEK